MPQYSENFFTKQKVDSYQSAQVVVPLVLAKFKVASVIDIGCGLGAWLKVFAEQGVKKYQGIDGAWVDRDQLLIPVENFITQDLEQPIMITGDFDLAICLELAEHLSPRQADDLVNSLTKLAPIILFSAAIPGQDLYGQINHINEQWPEYWAKKFLAHGYRVIDYLRDQIWLDDKVKYWYQQNILLYVSQSFLAKHKNLNKFLASPDSLTRIHPKTYREVLKYYKK